MVVFPSDFFFGSAGLTTLFVAEGSPTCVFTQRECDLRVLRTVSFSRSMSFNLSGSVTFFLRSSGCLSGLGRGIGNGRVLVMRHGSSRAAAEAGRRGGSK